MFDLVIGTLLSSFCNFAAQHIYTEPLTKLGEVKYPQVRLNPANICQIRQISTKGAKYLPTFSGQLKACTSWRLSTSIIAPAPQNARFSAPPCHFVIPVFVPGFFFRSMFVARLYLKPRPPPPLRPCVWTSKAGRLPIYVELRWHSQNRALVCFGGYERPETSTCVFRGPRVQISKAS